MKILLIALFVLASTVAFAADTVIDYEMVCDESKGCSTFKLVKCANNFEEKDGTCVPKKGHCPHCGAKRVDSPAFWICRGSRYACSGPVDGEILFCPNGHVFWEK